MKMLISWPNDRSILFHARLLCKRRIKRSKEASLLKIHGGKNLPVNDIGFFFQGTVFCRARSRWQSTAVAAPPDHSTARRPVPDHRAAIRYLKPAMAPAEFYRALAGRPASAWSRRRQRGVRIASARHYRPSVARRPAAARILRWLPFNISSPGLLVIFRRFPCDISS